MNGFTIVKDFSESKKQKDTKNQYPEEGFGCQVNILQIFNLETFKVYLHLNKVLESNAPSKKLWIFLDYKKKRGEEEELFKTWKLTQHVSEEGPSYWLQCEE